MTQPHPSSDCAKDGHVADQLIQPIQPLMKLFPTTRTRREWFNEYEKPQPPTAIAPQTLIAWSVFGLFLMALLTAMYFVQAVLMPVVAAAVVAVIFSPVMRWLERRRLPSSVSALVITVGFILAIAAAATAVESVKCFFRSACSPF